MTPHARRMVVLLLAVALVALLLLAMSLSGLQLQAGNPFPGSTGNNAFAPTAGTQTASSYSSSAVVQAVLGVILLVLLVYLPSRLARLLTVRNILWLLGGLLLLVGLVSTLPRVFIGATLPQANEAANSAPPPSVSYPVSPLGEPPAGFEWLAAASLLAATGLMAFLLFRRTSRRGHAAQAVGQEAQKAIQDLQAGDAFRDVIVRCYLQMTDVLRAEQKIERRESMTPHEFQDWLEVKGIPAAPVQRLTALFEAVRYGNGQLDQQAEAAGLDCLRQITRYCRAGRSAE